MTADDQISIEAPADVWLPSPDATSAPIVEWVACSGVSLQARNAPPLLVAEAGRQRHVGEQGERSILRRLLGVQDDAELDNILGELAALGFLERRDTGWMIHMEPPECYTGPRSIQEWSRRNGLTSE